MKKSIFFVLTVLLLSACGTDMKDRTQGGAAAGASAGAAAGIWGGPPGMLVGALIGAGAGAVTGATVSEDKIDLGEPIWKDWQKD